MRPGKKTRPRGGDNSYWTSYSDMMAGMLFVFALILFAAVYQLVDLQQKKTIAVVVDEFGGTSGIVSLEDLVEEIFGDIEDEHDNTSYISKQIDEREYVLSARLEIEKVNETFGLDLPESDDYLTVGGLILNQYQSFPKLHEVVRVGRYQFKIIKVTATKIELVRLKVLE